MPTKSKKQRHESTNGHALDLSYIAENLHPLAVPIGELCPDPANARKHDQGSITAIAASLRVYGQVKPVVALRENGKIIAGNGTLQAALSLGWTHLAAVKVDMDGATAAGFSISDNRTAELSSWDKEALDALLRECSTGNDPRLDEMMAELHEEMTRGANRSPTDSANDPNAEWQGMPEFEHEKIPGGCFLRVFFYKKEDLLAFGELIGQNVEDKKEIYFPAKELGREVDSGYIAEDCNES